MRRNFLNGSIPAGFFRLPSLDMLELNDNYLSGELPENIFGGMLGNFALSNNWITGKIPESIENLGNFEILSLDMNNFSGEILGSVLGLKKLSMLNLNGNGLTGEIPASIARCSHLTFVDLSRNVLEDSIMGRISILQNLNVLNVSRNRLGGLISSELGLMKSLTILDLSYNDFSGRRPVTGLLKDLDDRFLARNPNLCLRNATIYSSGVSPSRERHLSNAYHIEVQTQASLFFLLLESLQSLKFHAQYTALYVTLTPELLIDEKSKRN